MVQFQPSECYTGNMTAMDDKSLTDKIYQELVDGLKTGDLDWTHFIAKYGASKSPLYNAVGRFFKDMEPQARALSEAQTKASETELQLKALREEIGEADKAIKDKNRAIARLEQKQDTLRKKAEAFEGQVGEKAEILEQLRVLEKSGFDKDRLEALHTAISEIAGKRGLKPAKTADAFFADLKDYDAKVGFEQELQRLAAATEAARLEAEKWSTEARSCEKKHKDLQRTINAVESLGKRGVKPGQVVSWDNLLTGVGGVEELEKCLERYGSVHKVLATEQQEQQQLEARILEARATVKTLAEQQAELEASIKAIRESAIKEVEQVSSRGLQQVDYVTRSACDSIEQAGRTASAELNEVRTMVDEVAAHSITAIGKMGETALGQLTEAMSLVDQVSARALEAGQTVNQAAEVLARSRKITTETKALLARVEQDG